MKENTLIKQNSIKAWILASRPKTLTGAAVPVMIGMALAFEDSKLYTVNVFSWFAVILCFMFAFIMQIDANLINDFFDFVNGNDDETRLGPRRACAQGWISIDSMKRGIALTTVIACAVGLPLVLYGGLEMILIGILCVLFCFLYTTRLSSLGLGDMLVVIFFGIVPVCITYYVQLHTVTMACFIASLSCGLIIDTLLIINNFRDRDNDLRVGKRTLVVILGAESSSYVYLFIGFIACGMNIILWHSGHILAFILPLIYLMPHYITYHKMIKINKGKALNKILGETARNIFMYGVLVTLGLFINI